MNIQMITPAASESRTAMSSGAESLTKARERVRNNKGTDQTSTAKKNEVQPEELLQNIKALTDNGIYSVRFEINKDTNDLVINLVDSKTGDVIRQIPPKEILGMREALSKLSGNIVETKS